MSNRTKLGLNILEAALLLGVLGDALLRQTPWGINLFLWTGALVIAICALHVRWGRTNLRTDGGWLLLPVGFFAAAFAWRDSATLNLLDGLAVCTALALLAWRVRGRSIRLASIGDYVLGLGQAGFDVLFASLPLVFRDVQWTTIPRGGVLRHVWAVARGVVIAVPLLFLFGALFMAADAVFEGIMRQTFQLDLGVLFSHFFLMLLFTWLVGGFLRGMMLHTETAGEILHAAPAAAATAYTSITIDDKDDKVRTGAERDATRESVPGEHRQPPASVVVEGGATAEEDKREASSSNGGDNAIPNGDARGRTGDAATTTAKPTTATTETTAKTATTAAVAATQAAKGFSLGAVEVGVVLGLLDVLFACFVIVQFRYFFGGAARVMSITALTYSEYARRGFFELTWVAGLVLPLLLITHALLRRTGGAATAAERIFRPLAGTQVALLFVIMASAVARMRLYQSEYGLTELRLYTTAFMLWLGLVFVWFAWTVLVRNARERFACGALVAAFLTTGLLHLLNPDAYIVRANAAHARAGRAFDAEYAASLSADAVPALISAMPSLSRDERCLVARVVAARWSGPAPEEDWRAWNLARSRARRTVAAHQEDLSEATCTPPVSSVPVITPTATSAPESSPASHDTTITFTPANTTTNTTAAPTATNGTTNGATTNTTTNATTNTTTNATTMSMITEPKGATANASAAKRAKPAPSGANKRAVQLKRARVARGAKAR
jgi:hypothetical protein